MSPGRSEPRFLVIGRIMHAHGVGGEVSVELHTDFPDRFRALEVVYLAGDQSTGLEPDEPQPIHLEQYRLHKNRALLKLAGCDSRDDAEQLRGRWVQIPIEQAMPLGEDEYYEYQIIGLEVWTDQGERLGQVGEILYTGSNDVYVVNGPSGEILIPALEDVVLEVDLEQGRMLVALMEGLR